MTVAGLGDQRAGQKADPQRSTQGIDDVVEQKLPDIAKHDAADQVGYEKTGAVQVAQARLAGGQQRQQKSDEVDEHDVDRRVHQRDQERVDELRLAEHALEVGKPNPGYDWIARRSSPSWSNRYR